MDLLKSGMCSESAQPVAGVASPAAQKHNLKQPASIKTSAAFYHKNTLRNGRSLLRSRDARFLFFLSELTDDLCLPNSI